jgi:thioredoxin-like negative regulator of GroEL
LSTTLEKYYTGDIPIENIDIDTKQDMAIKYNIRSVPTCVLVDDNGSELRRQGGVMMIDKFEEFLKG